MIYNNQNIYTLHEDGAPSHFFGLEFLANQKSVKLNNRELNVFRQVGSAIKHGNYHKLFKAIKNIEFLVTLLFTRNKTIVLGLAPYNFNLLLLRFFFKKHRVFYFTSYTCWDQSRMAHSKYYSPKVLSVWMNFLSTEVQHIFAVTQRTSDELVANEFSTNERITVVNHSYKEKIVPLSNTHKESNFIAVGGLLKSKGIDELIEIFKNLPNCNLTIVGKGPLESVVLEAASQYKNIRYKGYIKGLKNIIPVYQQNTFLLLNSHRTDTWEELFGIVLIEAMACGLIPITTDHSGPKEVIAQYISGIICKEGEIFSGIKYVLDMDNDKFEIMKQNAINRAQEYQSSIISERWAEVFK